MQLEHDTKPNLGINRVIDFRQAGKKSKVSVVIRQFAECIHHMIGKF